MELKLRRRIIIIASITAVLLLLIVPAVFPAEKDQSEAHRIEEIYHVYYEEEWLGTVQNKDMIKKYIEEKLPDGEEVSDQWVTEKMDFIPELVFEVRGSDEVVLASLKENLE